MINEKVLWISITAPYDKVPHAGGQIHNFYLKKLYSLGIPIFLLTRCSRSEVKSLDMKAYNISHDVIIPHYCLISKIYRKICAIISTYNPFDKYAALLPSNQKIEYINHLNNIKKLMDPKIIILQWTNIILLLPLIKKIFPKSLIITIEEDVSYLGYQRKYIREKQKIYKWILKKQYQNLKKIELNALENSDLIIVNNKKDKNLLLNDGLTLSKIVVWCPYFKNLSHLTRKPKLGTIIYYGAMGRKENYLSIIWFINEVFNKINNENLCLLIIGGNPHYSLFKYEKSNIKILGYVDKIETYFETAMCLVAPLVLGAGVKIKVLEALSAGIPILTNSIGIEGIDATDTREYFHCESPEEYKKIIAGLMYEKFNIIEMMERERVFMDNYYNIDISLEKIYQIINHYLNTEI